MNIMVDTEKRIVEVNGMKYSFELFEAWGQHGAPLGTVFIFDKRVDGIIELSIIGKKTKKGIKLYEGNKLVEE